MNGRLFVVAVVGLVLSGGCRRAQQAVPVYETRIGIAIRLPDRICMAMKNSKLLPSATITLLAPADTARGMLVDSARALVALKNAEACPGTRADAGLTNYTLNLTAGEVEQGRVMIALDARVPSVGAAHSFRACHSGSGILLTAWDGAKPLEGRRLWKQSYTTSGQTEAPDCSAAESD